MTTITIQRPVAVLVPRAAGWAATAFLQVLAWVENHAQTRTMRRQASMRAAEAAAVHAYARQIEELDPRFAADLRAAADRHESSV